MRILTIAPPGAGKGTQSTLIAAHFGIPHISSGEAHVALYLKADDEELVRRLLARATVEHRADDTEPTIRKRLALYREVTHPIVDWYDQRGILVSVDATRAAEEVGREVLAALEVIRSMVDPAGGRRSVDLTGSGGAFGQDYDSS